VKVRPDELDGRFKAVNRTQGTRLGSYEIRSKILDAGVQLALIL